MRRRVRQIASVAAPLAALVAIWLLIRTSLEPLAKLKLPDGTDLYLKRISIGNVHRYKTPMSMDRPIWQRIEHFLSGPTGRITSQGNEETVVFFFASSAEPKIASVSTTIQRVRCVWEDGRVTKGIFDQSFSFWTEATFPRREKAFKAQVFAKGQWHDWILPNPIYGRKFPTWTPESFPQDRIVAGFNYHLRGWKKTAGGWDLDYTIAPSSLDRPPPVVLRSYTEFFDPTGNRSFGPLSLTEPVWKVQHNLYLGNFDPPEFHRAEFFLSPPER